MSLQVLLIVNDLHEEFRKPVAELRESANVISCETARDAADYLSEVDCHPTLVVIVQSRPGEYASDELDRLVQLAPLSRFVLLLGSWCEGETRTGQVWPGATRVFWYDWPGELAKNLPALSSGRFASWLVPPTTLEEERYLLDASSESLRQSGRKTDTTPTVLVCTRRSSYGDAICYACRQQGYSAVWQRPDRPAQIQQVGAIIWEGIQLLPAEEAELQALASLWPNTPIIALADFPRFETQERALAAGAFALLAKPCSLADLLAQLQHCCPLPLAAGKTSTAEVA